MMSRAHPSGAATRLLKTLYIGTIAGVSALAITGQIMTQRSLQNQANDSRIINIAGRQRMLSQKISKAALALQISDEMVYQQRRQELQEAAELWSRSHEGLMNGDPELGLPGNNSSQVTAMYADITPYYQAMLAAVNVALSTDEANLDQVLPAVETILANEADFLQRMNAIVFQYDDEAKAKLESLKVLQWSLLTITLLVLLPLFLPIQAITRKVNNLIQKMQQSGIQVTSSSTQIAASGKQLETMMTEQVAATHQVTASAQEIAKTAVHLVNTMDQVAVLAQGTTQAASNGQQGLTQMEVSMQKLSQSTQSIATKLGIISERAHSINTIVATITKVADQTKPVVVKCGD